MAGKSRDDDILDLDSSDSDFSGFSAVSPSVQKSDSESPPRLKSKVKVMNKKDKSAKKGAKKETKKKSKSKKLSKDAKVTNTGSLLANLSESDLTNLRGLLGIQPPLPQLFEYEEPLDPEWQDRESAEWQDPLPLRVQFNAGDLSDEEQVYENKNLNQGFRSALGDDGDDWTLPKDVSKEKGKPVSASLAKMINTACTTPCEVQVVLDNNKMPENCEKACPPMVNPEVWSVMDKKARSQDRLLYGTQNIVAGAISPIAKLAELLKTEISANAEAKALISDALTCLGQAQYKLSIRRRYAIRPSMGNKYMSLCNMKTPVTKYLFGDDIGKDIKACDSFSYIGKDQHNRGPQHRGRGFARYPRRPYHYGPVNYGQGAAYGGGVNYQRYQPYPPRGARGGMRGYVIPRRTAPTATVTSPNDKA